MRVDVLSSGLKEWVTMPTTEYNRNNDKAEGGEGHQSSGSDIRPRDRDRLRNGAAAGAENRSRRYLQVYRTGIGASETGSE